MGVCDDVKRKKNERDIIPLATPPKSERWAFWCYVSMGL